MRPSFARLGWAIQLLIGGAMLAGCLCPQGQLLCDGECVSIEDNVLHCGACGRACGAGECQGSTCLPPAVCGPRAASPVDCEDGDPCNGISGCDSILGQCVMVRAPVRCSDSISCTRSACVPETGLCEHIPDDALCMSGWACDATRGCIQPCAFSPCSVGLQCGCGGGSTCIPEGSAGVCTSGRGALAGELCSSARVCDAGLICAGVGTNAPRCSIPCLRNDQCASGTVCFVSLGYETQLGNGDRYGRCEDFCDPVGTAGCTTGACRMLPTSSANTFCGDYANVNPGTSCILDEECGRGQTCVRYSNGQACGRLCHSNLDCPLSESCLSFTTPIFVRGQMVGVCGR